MSKRREPRKEVQATVRIFGTDSSGKVFTEKATVVNISRHGVELSDVQPKLNLDEIVGLTYGTNRVHFRVKWVGQSGTPKAGHVGLLNISPEKPLWDFPLPDATPDTYRGQISVERRQYPRFKCHNSVELHTPSGGSFWATIAELSVAGCFIEMAIPLQPGSAVRVGIWINEIKVWAESEVTYSTPGFGIGVKFNKISAADVERIRLFLGTLSPLGRKAGL